MQHSPRTYHSSHSACLMTPPQLNMGGVQCSRCQREPRILRHNGRQARPNITHTCSCQKDIHYSYNIILPIPPPPPIPPGEELTISYLGGPQLLPLDARREALGSAFGFECGCPRCRAEEELSPGLATLLQDTASRVRVGGSQFCFVLLEVCGCWVSPCQDSHQALSVHVRVADKGCTGVLGLTANQRRRSWPRGWPHCCRTPPAGCILKSTVSQRGWQGCGRGEYLARSQSLHQAL